VCFFQEEPKERINGEADHAAANKGLSIYVFGCKQESGHKMHKVRVSD